MGIFQKIFGKGNTESDSGKTDKIYPILKPADWVGIEHGSLYKIFLDTDQGVKVVVGFGYNTPSNFKFITEDELGGKTRDEIISEAYKNIDEYPYKFEVVNTPGGKILLASGKDFSSEKILSPVFMKDAQRLLETNEIYVAIPRRKCLMLIAKNNAKGLGTFFDMQMKTWDDDSHGNAPILISFITMSEGVVTGFTSLEKYA